MCAVCATTPALVYGAATTRLNLPGITGAISRKKLLIFVPIISDCLKKSSRKAVQEGDGETFYWHSSRHPAAVLTIRMMQTAEIPTTGMSGMDRNHLPTTANIFSVSAPNSVFSLSHVQRPSTVLLWKMTAIFSPVSWKAIRKMMRQTVRCSTICPKICAIQKI